MLIPIRQAVFHSDFCRRVAVRPLGYAAPADLHWSHGACFSNWGEAGADDLTFAMLQIFTLLTREAEIPVGRVHRAFCAIPEYRATLLPEHPDALSAEEFRRLRPMLDIPKTIHFQIAG